MSDSAHTPEGSHSPTGAHSPDGGHPSSALLDPRKEVIFITVEEQREPIHTGGIGVIIAGWVGQLTRKLSQTKVNVGDAEIDAFKEEVSLGGDTVPFGATWTGVMGVRNATGGDISPINGVIEANIVGPNNDDVGGVDILASFGAFLGRVKHEAVYGLTKTGERKDITESTELNGASAQFVLGATFEDGAGIEMKNGIGTVSIHGGQSKKIKRPTITLPRLR